MHTRKDLVYEKISHLSIFASSANKTMDRFITVETSIEDKGPLLSDMHILLWAINNHHITN